MKNKKLKLFNMPKCILTLFLLTIFVNIPSHGSEVKIAGEKGNWKLLVDEKQFYIKGVGCGLAQGKKGEDYLKLAKELGANCVRTWGIDQGNKAYLDKAWEYGIMVNAGIWLNWPKTDNISYIGVNSHKNKLRRETLDYIKQFKDHPAILMWNIGNEVLFFSESEEEKIAFCKFLESLIRDIKQIDPKHPIIYASAAYLNLKYLKEYVPSLDIIGMNSYCSIRTIHSSWDFLKINRPYVITEYGPYLPSDSRRDINGGAIELGDYQKASIYRDYTEQIKSFEGCNLGGFAFHLGETTQESMTWWNINEGNLKKQSYWSIYEAYTGKPASCSTPKISKLILSKIRNLNPGEIIDAEVKVADQKHLLYEWRISTALEGILKYYVNQYIGPKISSKDSKVKLEMPKEEGIYRIHCFVKDKNGNVSSINKSVNIGSSIN